jgi:predicted dinucleotide-binding enzyme
MLSSYLKEILHEVRHYWSGKIGSALARTFARRNIEVAIANTRGAEKLSSLAEELGSSVHPQSLKDAYEAEMIFLAVPFPVNKEVAKQLKQWNGKIVVDLTRMPFILLRKS